MPLAIYQGYDLSESQSVSVFLQKLFAMADVPFDDGMTKAVRDEIARDLSKCSNELSALGDTNREAVKSDVVSLRQYLDKRFLELHSMLKPGSDVFAGEKRKSGRHRGK